VQGTTSSKPPKVSRNFLNAFVRDSRCPGIKLLDRAARGLRIEFTSRGGPASACLRVVPRSAVVLVWGRSDPGSCRRPVGDGLPVGGIDGCAESRGSFCPQG
jgi:hypothetical protein